MKKNAALVEKASLFELMVVILVIIAKSKLNAIFNKIIILDPFY